MRKVRFGGGMWLEVKILFGVFAMVCCAIVLTQILFVVDILLSFLLIMSIGFILIGDMMIGAKIKGNDCDKLMDTPPKGKEWCAFITNNGLLRFLWVDKKPHGKREFVFHGQEASYTNTGESQIHTLNGNMGCLAHEDHDTNIILDEVKIAEDISKDFQSDDLKEIYYKAKRIEAVRGVDLIK